MYVCMYVCMYECMYVCMYVITWMYVFENQISISCFLIKILSVNNVIYDIQGYHNVAHVF